MIDEINSRLALLGGMPLIRQQFKAYNSIGHEELIAVTEVMKTGVLSKFLGVWHEDFYGGPKVREFEHDAAKYFGVKHAITVNSWTSGLIAAVGAVGVEPGDEVIVTPWTMSATASAILHWGGIPVFADIDINTYNLELSSIEKNLSPHTKAILVADIFGQSADMDEIMSFARARDLKVISDTAQAPGAKYKNKYAGTLADIGGFSLNYHKHIHTGEGGILVTNDDGLAERLCLIRNHGEAVVGDKGVLNISNTIGYNFRMGEIEAAIGIEQLKKLEDLVVSRQKIANQLTDGLKGLVGLRLPNIRVDRDHVYYTFPMQIDTSITGVSRDLIADALQAEGVSVSRRYQNIHLLPIFQKKIAYGTKGFPWTSNYCKREIHYHKGICPNAEFLNDSSYLGFGLCVYDLDESDVSMIISAFKKVWKNLNLLSTSSNKA
jgi:perosamine synthetase